MNRVEQTALIADINEGMSVSLAAKRAGISRGRAYRVLEAHGITVERRPETSQPSFCHEAGISFDELVNLRRAGTPWVDLMTMVQPRRERTNENAMKFRMTIRHHAVKRGLAWPIEVVVEAS